MTILSQAKKTYTRIRDALPLYSYSRFASTLTKIRAQDTEHRSVVYSDYIQQIDKSINQPYPYNLLKAYSWGHPYLRIVHGAAITEVLRTLPESGNWAKERFAKKCTGCGREYKNPVEECEDCGAKSKLRDPDPEEKTRLNNFFDNPNRDDETRDIISSILRDHLACDDAYISVGNVGGQTVIYAEDASEIFICANTHGRLGNGAWFCPECWDHQTNDEIFPEKGRCPKCNGQLVETAYVQRKGNDSTVLARFGRDEIIHINGDPSLPQLYGNSKVPPILDDLRTAIAVTTNNFRTYSKGQLSKIIGLKGETQDKATEIAKAVHDKQEKVTRDPMTGQISRERNMTLFLGLTQGMETADLMPTPEDMQTIQLLEWILVKIVGATYGVQPVMINQSASPTGYHERMSVTVDQDRTRERQKLIADALNEQLIINVLGIRDWVFMFDEVEGRNELEEAQIWLQKVRAGKEAVNAGLTAELTEEGELKITGKFVKQEPTDMFGNPQKPVATRQEGKPEQPEAFNPTKSKDKRFTVIEHAVSSN